MNSGASTRAASIRRPNRICSIAAATELEALTAVWISGTVPVPSVDGESVPAQQGPPFAEDHPLERMEDMAREEVLESLGHRWPGGTARLGDHPGTPRFFGT